MSYVQTAEMSRDLPDILQFEDGRPVLSTSDWALRRRELCDLVLAVEYGAIPPTPKSVTLVPFSACTAPGDAQVQETKYQVITEQPRFSFSMTLYAPQSDLPLPVIVDGDGCWDNITHSIIADVIGRGYALAVFNRVEIVGDEASTARDTGLYGVFPDDEYGALSAWAWGYQRVVDGLLTLPFINPGCIAVTGHSRGGKAALLAGAFDERVALTAPNNSGCGGAASFWKPDPGGEQLADMMHHFSYWVSPRLKDYADKPSRLPFDQHAVLALVAPRAILTTEALSDTWSSPKSTRLMHEAALPVFRLFGTETAAGIYYRAGGHGHLREDWAVLLDFADQVFFGKPNKRDFDAVPE